MTEAPQIRPAAVVVLAAGSGTRMKSKLMKVLHPVGGRSMIGHVLTAALHVEPDAPGGGRRQQPRAGRPAHPRAGAARAAGRAGDPGGHRARRRVALDALRDAAGTTDGVVVVMAGDTPLLEGETLAGLVRAHAAGARAITVLTAEVADPFGYGRILRDDAGEVTAIVEEKEATPDQAAVARDQQRDLRLRRGVPGRRAGPDRPTTTPRVSTTSPTWCRSPALDGRSVGAHRIDDVMQTEGANDRAQLARSRRRAQPPHPGPLDAGRRDDRRPRVHLDRRGRRARARRHDPAGRAAAGRHGRRGGRGGRSGHAR